MKTHHFNRKISYGHQWLDEDDIQSVCDVLRSDYLTCGPKIKELENTLAEYIGATYAVAVANGTAALHCACIAAGIQPEDEVITTPLTFAASANCILYCGAKPVFADINPETYNIDPQSIREHITDKTKAVIAVVFTEQAVQVKEIQEICDQYNLLFIEDAAHSIGTQYDGERIGSLADMTCFSFHPVKTVTSGEGGAILTNDKQLYDKIILAHTHGITKNIQQMENKTPEGNWYYEEICLGFNYRITDFQAALLISQMKKLDYFIERRKNIVKRYNEAFTNMPEILIQKEIPELDTCRHLYIIRLNLELLSCSRKEFYDALCAENVQCQVHYIPVYWFPLFQRLGYEKGLCPKAEEIYRGIVSIPLYPKMTVQDVEGVIRAVKKVIRYYKKF